MDERPDDGSLDTLNQPILVHLGYVRRTMSVLLPLGTIVPSNFAYSGPFTEMVLLGTIAVRVPGKLKWDGKNMRFTNSEMANRLVSRRYRAGWELP